MSRIPLLDSLEVLHLQRRAQHDSAVGFDLPLGWETAFFLDTCQRRVWARIKQQELGSRSSFDSAVEIFEGAQAYAFLLRVATGLESELKGETDIFGQLKGAWAAFEKTGAPMAGRLGGIFQKLFEDAKEVRALYLQNIGGGASGNAGSNPSYGSLVRRLLRDHSTGPHEKLLIIGAGHIAHSVAPWLTEHELWIWNRSPQSAERLVAELRSKGARARVVPADDEARAWSEASHAVICIPADPETDRRRIDAWSEGLCDAGGRSVIHLGGFRAELGAWNELPNIHPLDDLFELQKRQNEARADQFARALRACEQKAQLRTLSGHGWEDLAIFA